MAPMPSARRTFAALLRPRRLLVAVAAVLIAAAVGGCSTLGYYAQSISGHVAVMRSARAAIQVKARHDKMPSISRACAASPPALTAHMYIDCRDNK